MNRIFSQFNRYSIQIVQFIYIFFFYYYSDVVFLKGLVTYLWVRVLKWIRTYVLKYVQGDILLVLILDRTEQVYTFLKYSSTKAKKKKITLSDLKSEIMITIVVLVFHFPRSYNPTTYFSAAAIPVKSKMLSSNQITYVINSYRSWNFRVAKHRNLKK